MRNELLTLSNLKPGENDLILFDETFIDEGEDAVEAISKAILDCVKYFRPCITSQYW